MAWQDRLRPSSFRGVSFHVDEAIRGGGRRQALFEFPKRDEPYAEDMGRRARRFTVVGYLIGPNYIEIRDALIDALEQEGPGQLEHYLYGSFRVSVDNYTTSESRERGGMCRIDMQFVEAGQLPAQDEPEDTQSKTSDAANTATSAAMDSADIKARTANPAAANAPQPSWPSSWQARAS